MSAEYFLDTNIFVYSFDTGSPAKAARAHSLIRDTLANGKGIVSYQVVQEFFNVALRRFAKPMTPAEADQYLSTVFRPLLAVHSSPALYGDALRLCGRYGLAWYDALIVAAAADSGCAKLYSEELQHGFQIGRLRIENPFL